MENQDNQKGQKARPKFNKNFQSRDRKPGDSTRKPRFGSNRTDKFTEKRSDSKFEKKDRPYGQSKDRNQSSGRGGFDKFKKPGSEDRSFGDRKPFRDRDSRPDRGPYREKSFSNRDSSNYRKPGEGSFNRDRGDRNRSDENRGNYRKPGEGSFNRDRGDRNRSDENRSNYRKPGEGSFNRGPRRDRDDSREKRPFSDRGRSENRNRNDSQGESRGGYRDRDQSSRGDRDRGSNFRSDRGPSRGGFQRGKDRPGFDKNRGGGGRNRISNPEELKEKVERIKRILIKPDASENFIDDEIREKKDLLNSLKEKESSPFLENLEDYDNKSPIRINRFLARCGLGARRVVEEFVKQGRVSMNGEVVKSFSIKVNPLEDQVTFDGNPVQLIPGDLILAFNKPAGYLCSHHDVYHENTVFNLLDSKYRKFNMAGRLDLKSRGLMIFSSNGFLLNKISHPSMGIEKEYLVVVSELLPEQDLRQIFLGGMEEGGDFLRAKSLEVVDHESKKIRIILKEGKKRQIHRMFKVCGIQVLDLQRVRMGLLELGKLELKEGESKIITEKEIFGE
ncbi:MAG: pseudouridine synthase [Leptospiraceae bacterium]|nr:pseudouridine synthase [Leptospiraceae bacterium]